MLFIDKLKEGARSPYVLPPVRRSIADCFARAGIVDAYDTLTAPQPFGENMSPANALNIIYKGRGKQFHPALVEQFIQ